MSEVTFKTAVSFPFYLGEQYRPQLFFGVPTLEYLDEYLRQKGWTRNEGLLIDEEGGCTIPEPQTRLELYLIKED